MACSNLSTDKFSATSSIQWHSLSDPKFEIRGLPWFEENAPETWRLPKSAKDKVPVGVWKRAVAPDGGRVRMKCSTSRLFLKIERAQHGGKPCFFDVYVNGQMAGSARAKSGEPQELQLFENKDRGMKNITIYLPNNHEARVVAVGVDAGSRFQKPQSFAHKKPLVCYGSSVLQGTGAAHPSKTYPAALARRLNLDFVNLGFGGAGKAEPGVVSLVNQLDACCFLFDLGKSYGNQGIEPYAKMLDAIRAKHPKVPIICVTPIYSTKERTEPGYLEKSEDLRDLVRKAASERREKGDESIIVVEGLHLFNEADQSLLNDPLHPNDDGNERIAERLAPILAKILGIKEMSRLPTSVIAHF